MSLRKESKDIIKLKQSVKEIRLHPILKWAGEKEQELKYIHPTMPKKKQGLKLYDFIENLIGKNIIKYYKIEVL